MRRTIHSFNRSWKRAQHRITQHKRLVPYGTHPNPSLTLRTSFMLKPLAVREIFSVRAIVELRTSFMLKPLGDMTGGD